MSLICLIALAAYLLAGLSVIWGELDQRDQTPTGLAVACVIVALWPAVIIFALIWAYYSLHATSRQHERPYA